MATLHSFLHLLPPPHSFNCSRNLHPPDALVIFHTAKFGSSEEFEEFKQPFQRLHFVRRMLVNRWLPTVLIVMLLKGMPQKFTLFIQVSFPLLIWFQCPIWSEQLTIWFLTKQIQWGAMCTISFSLSSVMGKIRWHSILAASVLMWANVN